MTQIESKHFQNSFVSISKSEKTFVHLLYFSGFCHKLSKAMNLKPIVESQ